MLIVFAPLLAMLSILTFKVYRWKEFCRTANRPVSFKVFYPQSRIVSTSSDKKRDFMVASNRMSIAAIVMIILAAALYATKDILFP